MIDLTAVAVTTLCAVERRPANATVSRRTPRAWKPRSLTTLTSVEPQAGMSTAVALGLAVLAAVGYGLAAVMQGAGMRGATTTAGGMLRPIYAGGLALDLLSWLVSLVALRSLPVFQVQAIVAGSLAVTAVAARIFLHTSLGRRAVVAIGVAVACLAVVSASSAAQEATVLGTAQRWVVASAAGAVLLLGLAAARVRHAAVSAVAAGLAFGGTALCSRAITLPDRPLQDLGHTASTVAGDPLTWALLAYAACGLVFYAQALQFGQVAPVMAILNIVSVVVPAVVGVALLGDAVRAGWAVPAVLAVVGVLGAAVVLSASVAEIEDAPATPA